MTDSTSEKVSLYNPDGYVDSTAHNALNNVLREQQIEFDEADIRNTRLIKTVRNMIDLAGFELLNRIEVKDRKTGRNYR